MPLTVQEIARRLEGELAGPPEREVTGVEGLDRAAPNQLTFVRDGAYREAWRLSASGATVVANGVDLPEDPDRAVIRVADVDEAIAAVLRWFAPPSPAPEPGVSAEATVDPSARVAPSAAIGPHCMIGPSAEVGENAILHGHVTLMAGASIGSGTEVFPGTVIRERCRIGASCTLHPNVVIGADGFGYRASPDGPAKIPHIGTVEIADDVEIGAATCIDRAKFSVTEIGAGTKIDNLCQIAHNCRIGRGCVLAGQVGLAGSVTLGDGAVVGGKVSVKEQLTVGPGARLAACSAVMDDVPAGATWAGTPAREAQTALREHAALRKLPELVKWFKRQRADGARG